jgi:hypothetical protein
VQYLVDSVSPHEKNNKTNNTYQGRSYGDRLREYEVDGTGSGSCPMDGFFVGGINLRYLLSQWQLTSKNESERNRLWEWKAH